MTTPNVLVIHPDGRTLALYEPGDAVALAAHFCGGMPGRLAEAFHGLDHFEVWHPDDYAGHAVNLAGSCLIGMDLTSCAPIHGPIILIRLPDGQDLRAERAHQIKWFGLDGDDVQTQANESTVTFLMTGAA